MHNSDNPDAQTAAIRLYLDESGGDDPKTPHAVIGGLLITKNRFEMFENAWDQMLEDHGIEAPLHMKEFGRPHGRLANVSDCCRRELFQRVDRLIEENALATISVSISNEDFKKILPAKVGEVFSVYGMCFIMAMYLNHMLAINSSHQGRVPIIMDGGNPCKQHAVESHASMIQWQRAGTFWHLGSLTFDADDDFGVLQAADVIAWASRRRATNLPLDHGYEPLSRILDSEYHAHSTWESKWVKALANGILTVLRKAKEGSV